MFNVCHYSCSSVLLVETYMKKIADFLWTVPYVFGSHIILNRSQNFSQKNRSYTEKNNILLNRNKHSQYLIRLCAFVLQGSKFQSQMSVKFTYKVQPLSCSAKIFRKRKVIYTSPQNTKINILIYVKPLNRDPVQRPLSSGLFSRMSPVHIK